MKRASSVALLSLVAFNCGASPGALSPGESFENLTGTQVATVRSATELEIEDRAKGRRILATYTIEQPGRVRLVIRSIGPPEVQYWGITEEGWIDENGWVIYFPSRRVEQVRRETAQLLTASTQTTREIGRCEAHPTGPHSVNVITDVDFAKFRETRGFHNRKEHYPLEDSPRNKVWFGDLDRAGLKLETLEKADGLYPFIQIGVAAILFDTEEEAQAQECYETLIRAVEEWDQKYWKLRALTRQERRYLKDYHLEETHQP